MRRLLIGLVVVVATALAPLWALAGNQEVAERIAASLRASGQLHGYKIGVKFQDGTAWLRGQVTTHEQMNTALKLVFQTPGVTRVVNNLTISGDANAASVADQPAASPVPVAAYNNAPQPASYSQPMNPAPAAAEMAGQQLQQAAGAMAPEQFSRPAMSGTQMHAVGSQPDSVATSFDPAQTQGVDTATLEAPEPAVAAKTNGLRPMPIAYTQPVEPTQAVPTPAAQPGPPLPVGQPGAPIPQYVTPPGAAMAPPHYDQPNMPNYAWPSYAASPNYAALTYPKQYSPTAWPYIGPFYPYPQVPLGWRKVTLEWHDGWWNLDFDDGSAKSGWFSGLFRCK
jgi:hypothetical protein